MATLPIVRKKKITAIKSPVKPSRVITNAGNRIDEISTKSLKCERKLRKPSRSIDCVDIEYATLPPLPDIPILDESFEASIDNEKFPKDWLDAIEKRMQKFEINEKIEKRNQQRFRDAINKIEKENILLKDENENLKADIECRRIRLNEYEKKFHSSIEECSTYEMNMKKVLMENSRLLYQLNQKKIECQNLQDKLKSIRENIAIVLRAEHEKMKNLLIDSLANKNLQEQKHHQQQEAKFQVLQNLFNTDASSSETMHMVNSSTRRQRSNSESSVSPEKTNKRDLIRSNAATPVVNPKYDHETAKTNGKWINHQPTLMLPMGTIMKPVIKNKKSVTQLKTSDFYGNRRSVASKYALIHHEATNSGSIETKIFKGNVIPSTAGGAQIVFNDVELLKQIPPL